MDFIQNQISFFIIIIGVLFLPGFFVLHFFYKKRFDALEVFILSLPISIAIVNFLIMLIGKSDTRITTFSITTSIVTFLALIFFYSKIIQSLKKENPSPTTDSFAFSKKEFWLIISILALTLLIKTVYLSQSALPTATDLGHHMYWSKLTAVTGNLPEYEKIDIVQNGNTYTLSTPQPIDDFIIGEHLVFAAIALLSGENFISAFPMTVLLLVNIFTLLTLFIFTLHITKPFEKHIKPFSHKTIALFALLFLGPIYTLASPQAKFVSGGVVGNTFGNLFIPTILYLYWKSLVNKSASLLALAFFMTFGLAYIHHLSTLVFLFILIFTIAIFSLMHIRTIHAHLKQWLSLVFSFSPIIIIIASVCFFFFVLAPSYADPKALDTAIGAPTKATRTGLTFLQFTFSTGEGRLGFGIVGLLILAYFYYRNVTRKSDEKASDALSYSITFLFAWGFSLAIMSLRPQWLFLDIPSNRISTYAIFPFTILSALAFTALLSFMQKQNQNKNIPLRSFSSLAMLVFAGFFIINGFYDNSQSFVEKSKAQEAIETYHVSQYLSENNQSNDIILKDHNYIVADSWMKLFFLRDYFYPLSRGYFKRYEDETKPREQCTLWMISVPNTSKGEKCFDETGVNIVIVNPHYDSVQFKKSTNFSAIYQSNDIAVYMRK